MHLETHGIVLSKTPSNQCWRLHVITPELGLITCFQRQTKNVGKSIAPDLFDRSALLLKTAKSGSTRFVQEYHLLQRRMALATHYQNFIWATRFAKILLKNPLQVDAYTELYTLTQKALNLWEEGKEGASIYLKALYRLITLEGFPIKEDWITRLQEADKRSLLTLLNTPIHSLPKTEASTHKQLALDLERWMGQYADIHC